MSPSKLICALIASSAACTSGETATPSTTVFPTTGFTGVEDTGTRYVLPIAGGGTMMTWTAVDASVCQVVGTDVLGSITALKPGGCKVNVAGTGTVATVSV